MNRMTQELELDWWLARLCGFGKGGTHAARVGMFILACLTDSIRRPHLYEERKGGPAPKPWYS
jgi:hypothetical protein